MSTFFYLLIVSYFIFIITEVDCYFNDKEQHESEKKAAGLIDWQKGM